MHIDLSGKNILVTGASRGIGAALAEGLAAAGARVAVHYGRNAEAAQAVAGRIGGGAEAFGADLADVAAGERLVADVLRRFGGLDVVVHNAGVAHSIPLEAATEDWLAAWDHTIAVNLRAAELLTRLALRHFLAHGGGRLIYVASRAAFRGDTPDYTAYAASKGGMVALARSIARGYGKQGVRAFVLAPGFTRTDMAQDFIDAYGEDYALNDIALERLTEPSDLAPLTVLLASGLADHATGTTIDVNAGSYVR